MTTEHRIQDIQNMLIIFRDYGSEKDVPQDLKVPSEIFRDIAQLQLKIFVQIFSKIKCCLNIRAIMTKIIIQTIHKKYPQWLLKTNSCYSHLMPTYKNHTLYGDSNLVRFSQQVLNIQTTKNEYGKNCAGPFWVGGSGIMALCRNTRQNKSWLGDKIIILIGSNDVTNVLPVDLFKFGVNKIIKTKKQKNYVDGDCSDTEASK